MSNLDMVKIKIKGKIYDVLPSVDTYQSNMDAYLRNYTAIRSKDGKFALPIVKAKSNEPGIYADGMMSKEFIPPENEQDEYLMDNAVNLSDSKTITELLEKQSAVKQIEQEILVDSDNIFTPKIGIDDTPAIKALKTAVIEKHIDLDKYEPRFGSNYNNDKRLLSKNKISLPMMERVCNALDIRATLILEDKDDTVPNPIGRVIKVELTGNDECEEELDDD